jgi:hypothetical protein
MSAIRKVTSSELLTKQEIGGFPYLWWVENLWYTNILWVTVGASLECFFSNCMSQFLYFQLQCF